ncbi:MAG: class I adenylate-forming enzyme family protein [Candidatus Hermodarchaeota archaeon]
MSWLHLGEILRINASKYPNKLAIKDTNRSLTNKEFDERTNKLANGLLKRGLRKGDKIAILMNNRVEFMELYGAAAKAGLIIVPLNFRLLPKDLYWIVSNAECKMVIVESRYYETTINNWNLVVEFGLDTLDHICLGDIPVAENWSYFEDIIKEGEDRNPEIQVEPEDPWILLYTSGTTGRPKGVVRSHRSYISFFLINAAEFSFTPDDYGLILMPLSHVNSTFYSFVFTYVGASVYVHREFGFNPEEVLEIFDHEKITFTSLIPTHYNLILSLPDETKENFDLSSVKTLLTSSAPATKEMKYGVMDLFKGVRLFEAYGSTEAGLVTILRPEDQFNKVGSIGQECIGSDQIRLLDPDTRSPVSLGEIGELFSRSPMQMTGYYKLAEKTAASMDGEFFSAGDMAKKDEDGYYYLVDRKANMIISGGEHVFPSEVEKVITAHEAVLECAVVGLNDPKWGEAVTAICALTTGSEPSDSLANNIREHCRDKLPRFKVPKKIIFIDYDDIPRTGSGKIVHRILRERYNESNDS